MESWKRTYWAVFAANLITAAGMMSFLPFFPEHLRALGVTDDAALATWTGVIYGAAPLTAAFSSPLWGSLGDRFGRRLMVLRSMAAITVFVGLMALARSPWQLLGLRLLQGVFSGFVAPSLTLVSVAAPKEIQSRVSASLQLAVTLGGVLGPLLGAGLRRAVGVQGAYLGVSTLAVLSAVLILLFAREHPNRREEAHPRDTGGDAPRPSVAAVLRSSLRELAELRNNAGLRMALLIMFVVQFGMGATNPLLALYVEEFTLPGWLGSGGDEQSSADATALLFSVLALAIVATVYPWGVYADRHGHAGALKRCAAASALALGVHAFAPGYVWLLASRVLLGAVVSGSGPLAYGVAAAETASDRRGGAFGLMFSARAFAVAISAMIGGALSYWITIRGLFALCAILILGCLLFVRRTDGP